MSSLEITLNEFVTKIPLCQADVSWETIISTLYSSSNGFIAIVDRNSCPIGIVESHKILGAIAHKSIQTGIVTENPQSGSRLVITPSIPKLANLVSQIKTLSSDSKLKDLLASINNQESLISEKNYLIVNEVNKVEGILDIPKLLKYMAESHRDIRIDEQLDRKSLAATLEDISETIPEILWDLLEQIKLPLMLQNAEGNICYQNSAWHQHSDDYQKILVPELDKQPDNDVPAIADLNKLRRLQNEFMVNISHELKSPLTAIIGLSSLLKEEKLGSLNSRQIRYLDLIYRGGRQLMGMVTDLLDITSLATGKLKLNWENIELEEFCHQIYQQVIAKLKAVQDPHQNRSLVLPQFNLESETSLVIADRRRLSQILLRLLENALRSTPAEGEMGIKIEKWAEWIAIIVWDTGRGISETFQKSLLEEMFEPDNFLTSPERASGLGLILAQQLAQSHGGDISFTSQVDRGSEFTLLLPINHSSIGKPTSDRQSALVLIVETSAVIIKDLSEKLRKLGYHTAIARNQNEALYKASRLQPTKIILNNETMNPIGQNILSALRCDPQASKIPVLLIGQKYSPLITQYSQVKQILLSLNNEINPEILAEHFPSLNSPSINKNPSYCQGKRLTILRLCLTDGPLSFTGSERDLLFENPSFNLCHHIIEADSVEQAHMLARIWKIDTVIWDSSNLEFPVESLRSLVNFPNLAQIPIVTLDELTTAAANQFEDLTVFPCLIPINEQNIAELMEVIQSAATAIDN